MIKGYIGLNTSCYKTLAMLTDFDKALKTISG